MKGPFRTFNDRKGPFMALGQLAVDAGTLGYAMLVAEKPTGERT